MIEIVFHNLIYIAKFIQLTIIIEYIRFLVFIVSDRGSNLLFSAYSVRLIHSTDKQNSIFLNCYMQFANLILCRYINKKPVFSRIPIYAY